MGEGWHNNHHYYKSATRQGFYWWEVDLTYYILRALAAVGIVWDLKEPSEEIKNSNRVDGKGEAAVPEPASLEAADEPEEAEEARERAA
jgi:stearoyl-CoA desaturase (delta-9 desaturase)